MEPQEPQETQEPKEPLTFDSEEDKVETPALVAMQKVIRALMNLSHESQKRILRAASSFYGIGSK